MPLGGTRRQLTGVLRTDYTRTLVRLLRNTCRARRPIGAAATDPKAEIHRGSGLRAL